MQFLLLPGTVERRAFHLLQFESDARRVQVVHRRLRDGWKAGDRGEFAGVEAVGIAGFGQQLLGFLRIVGHRLCLQGEVHDPGNDDPCRRAEAVAAHLVDLLAVERVIDRLAQPQVMPRRFEIPLLGEFNPEDRGVLARHYLELRVLLDALGVDAVERVGDVGFAGLQHQRAGGGFGDAAHHHHRRYRRPPAP